MRKWFSLIIAVCLYYILGRALDSRIVLWDIPEHPFGQMGLRNPNRSGYWCDVSYANICVLHYGCCGYINCRVCYGVWQTKNIVKSSSMLLRAIAYYATLIFLCLDPLYLSVISHLVGGGDLNGMVLVGVPETVAVIFFLALLALNLFIFFKLVYPSYKQRFLEST